MTALSGAKISSRATVLPGKSSRSLASWASARSTSSRAWDGAAPRGGTFRSPCACALPGDQLGGRGRAPRVEPGGGDEQYPAVALAQVALQKRHGVAAQ